MDENNNRKGHSYTSKGPRGKRDFPSAAMGNQDSPAAGEQDTVRTSRTEKGNSAGNWNPVLNS